MMRSTTRRPILHIPRSPLERNIEILAVLGIAAIIALTIWAWFILPPVVPTHYNLAGRPNAYGGKGVLLLILPVVTIFVFALLTFLSRYPHTFNYPRPITEANAHHQYQFARTFIGVLKLEIVWLCFILQWVVFQATLARSFGLGILLVAVCFPIVIIATVVGYAMQAARAS
jgi:uncharacterized membrane protein